LERGKKNELNLEEKKKEGAEEVLLLERGREEEHLTFFSPEAIRERTFSREEGKSRDRGERNRGHALAF